MTRASLVASSYARVKKNKKQDPSKRKRSVHIRNNAYVPRFLCHWAYPLCRHVTLFSCPFSHPHILHFCSDAGWCLPVRVFM
jgi:hypothetical protein